MKRRKKRGQLKCKNVVLKIVIIVATFKKIMKRLYFTEFVCVGDIYMYVI